MEDGIDAIFNKTKQGRLLFQNRSALSTEFVPEHLPFRESQETNVAQVLAPALLGSKPSNLLLYGKTGTGKTAVAKRVVDRLEKKDDKKQILTSYVNCRSAGTEYLTLATIAESLPMDKIPPTGLSMGEVVKRIFKAISEHAIHLILVLDEIDYLVNANDDTLYKFTRSGEETAPGFLTIIGISNDLRFKEGLDARVLSSLGEEELVFPPYTTEELRSILAERTKIAFRPGVVPETTINLCAALAASEHGDARRAIDLLRVAGEVAEREGRQQRRRGEHPQGIREARTRHCGSRSPLAPTASEGNHHRSFKVSRRHEHGRGLPRLHQPSKEVQRGGPDTEASKRHTCRTGHTGPRGGRCRQQGPEGQD